MFIATIIAILFSFFAFGFSIYALWVVRVSPYRLLVYPPALSYLNRKEGSLVLDMTFFNPGRVRVALLDMEVTLVSRGQRVPGSLKPHACHQTLFPQNGGHDRHSIIARFTPILISKQETVTKTVYFAVPTEAKGVDWSDETIDCVRIAFKVNSRWNKKTFSLDYAQIQAFQKEKESSALLKMPFAPSFFPDEQPLYLRGSIFDPVY
jgi:phenylpropionate dioxygenase-like ring-hydroxylating dioxygenase large terminal subunit